MGEGVLSILDGAVTGVAGLLGIETVKAPIECALKEGEQKKSAQTFLSLEAIS